MNQMEWALLTLGHAREAILWMDDNGKLIYANPAACQLLGYTQTDLLQLTTSVLSVELTPTAWKQLWKEALRNGHFTIEIPLSHCDHHVFQTELNLHLMTLNSSTLACVFLRDISEHKRLQELKNEFISTVSHELRTPMTIIRESVSQVLEGIRGPVTKDQNRALTITLSGIDRLKRIITDILDISKIEAGKLTLRRERMDLMSVIQEVITNFHAQAVERGLSLRTDGPAHLEAYVDHDKIVQVLTNLVSNALKFTRQGEIVVSLQETENQIRCDIRDTGMGIAPGDLPRVFNKFEQLGHTSVTGEKGTGLGLSISKGIVELHKGHMEVASHIGQGTTFSFFLPKLTPPDLFKAEIQKALNEVLKSQGSFSLLTFTMTSSTPLSPLALERLDHMIRIHSARRSDILVKFPSGIYVGMPMMVKKEATRVAEKVAKAFQEDPSALPPPFPSLKFSIVSYPENAASEKELLEKGLGS